MTPHGPQRWGLAGPPISIHTHGTVLVSVWPHSGAIARGRWTQPRRTWGCTGARDCAPPRLWWPSDPPLVNTRTWGPAAPPSVVRTHSQQSEPSSFCAVARPHLRGRSMLTEEPAFSRPTPCQAECACPEYYVNRWGSCARQCAPTSTSESAVTAALAVHAPEARIIDRRTSIRGTVFPLRT